MIKIGDLIDVPDIKTVIQLKDLQEEGLREMIINCFVVTSEVMENLNMVFTSLSRKEGKGIFLKGHYGSGKSHFLSILSVLLRSPDHWHILISQEPSLERFRDFFRSRRFLVVEISLVQHRGTEFLEDIFLNGIFEEIKRISCEGIERKDSRHETFLEVKRALNRLGLSGMVLLVDELSEFLCSKTDAHAYNEDIRFLQYLGEEARSFPLWIISSLQEWIEETGEIAQDTFNKIKDRYPIRMNLGRAHIEELLSQRLIRHREGAEEEIRKIFSSIKRYFPLFPVEENRFLRLYPVHPATITLLDHLKPLFSEHRGIVDFIHYRLKGDEERGIPSFLERPSHELLAPSTIFDHFIHRIREMSETQPFIEKVYNSYEEEIPRIFKDEEQQKVAIDAIKLLILFAISPVKVRYTARHMAEMILFRVTDLESEINYQYLRDILERLRKETTYISVIPGEESLDDQFSISLKPDISSIMRQRIRQTKGEIFQDDRRLFYRLLPIAQSSHIPFKGWAEDGIQHLSFSWEYTRRSGTLLLRQIDEVSIKEIERMAEEWKRTEEDFSIFVGTTHHVEKQYEYLHGILSMIRERYPGMFLFWLPAKLEEHEEEWMKEVLSSLILLDRQKEDFSESSKEMKVLLENYIEGAKKRIGELFTKAYFSGLLIWDEKQIELSTYGYLSQERFLQEFLPDLLSRRFPKHHRIHPYIEALAPTTIPNLLREFFVSGMIEIDDRTKFGLKTILEGLLRPMGLVRKKGNQYTLQVDPRSSEIVEEFLLMVDKGPIQPETLYWSLRKGEYGLLRHQFEALLFSLLFSGNVVAYQGSRKKGLDEISRSGLQGITAIGKGEVLDEEVRKIIIHNPFIPDRFKNVPFTLSSQESMWNEIIIKKDSEIEGLKNLLNRINWASSFQAFKNIPWPSFRREIEDILAQWEEVKVSLPPREGLERFLLSGQRDPFLSEKLQRIGELNSFFDHAEKILFAYQYLSDPRLSIPDSVVYKDLRNEREGLFNFFESDKISIDSDSIEEFLERFQNFRERYINAYIEAHKRERSGDKFVLYERLRNSRRYKLLMKLDQIDMISTKNNRSFIDKLIFEVILLRCEEPSIDSLQNSPICRCGFMLGEEKRLTPIREIEEAIDRGIKESIETLYSSAYQEKIISYARGLEEVGEKEKASAIRSIMAFTRIEDEDQMEEFYQALTPLTIQGINEAFKGRVVIVNRDLDKLYEALLRRKYTLSQVKKIIKEWLREEEISSGAFIHFTGRGDVEAEVTYEKRFLIFIEENFPSLLPLLKEIGQSLFGEAMLLSIWARGYGISYKKLFPLLQYLRGVEEERGEIILDELSSVAVALQNKEPLIFQKIVQEIEEREEFPPKLWRLLEEEKASSIFRKEMIFSSVLKEAFERLLALPDEDVLSGKLSPIENPLLPSRNSNFIIKQKEMVEALNDYGKITMIMRNLKRRESNPPKDFQKWESLYIKSLSPFAFLLSTFPLRLERMGLNITPPVRDRIIEGTGLIQDLLRNFSSFYRENFPLWEAREFKRPKMIEDLLAMNIGRGISLKDEERIFILLDAMRWDLWEFLKEKYFGPMANQFRIVGEGALWAHLPSTTPRQMEILEEVMSNEKSKDIKVWKISGIDERVHSEKGSIEHLFRNILQYLQLELTPRLREIPSGKSLILFSDHGFIENPQFEKLDKYKTSRYIHGEDSPFEIIVPWAVLKRM